MTLRGFDSRFWGPCRQHYMPAVWLGSPRTHTCRHVQPAIPIRSAGARPPLRCHIPSSSPVSYTKGQSDCPRFADEGLELTEAEVWPLGDVGRGEMGSEVVWIEHLPSAGHSTYNLLLNPHSTSLSLCYCSESWWLLSARPLAMTSRTPSSMSVHAAHPWQTQALASPAPAVPAPRGWR